jgi:hypothetical protein
MKLTFPVLKHNITGIPLTIFLLLKKEYKSNDWSISISQQITLSGEDAKNASTIGLILAQGLHQVAPILIITNPGFDSNRRIN